jgi:hypothetical protein
VDLVRFELTTSSIFAVASVEAASIVASASDSSRLAPSDEVHGAPASVALLNMLERKRSHF